MKKSVLTVLAIISGAIFGGVGIGYLLNKEVNLQKMKVDKFRNYYNLLNQWLLLKNENKNLHKYFINNQYKTIAIYGMGEMGNRLIEELKDSNINIKYAVDKNSGGMYSNVEVLDLDDDLEEVDVIVVTATFAFNEIVEKLEKKVSCPIVSLEDVVYEI